MTTYKITYTHRMESGKRTVETGLTKEQAEEFLRLRPPTLQDQYDMEEEHETQTITKGSEQ